MRGPLLLCVGALLALSVPTGAAMSPKRLTTEYMLPMRDGVHLHTLVDFPPFYPADKKGPAIMERSPYGANAEELIATVFSEALGYVSVRQDMRGTHQSEGEFGCWHDSANDAYDTMEWISQQAWSNGEVFTTGASADCIDEYAQIANPHPALRGQVNVFGTTEGWETFYIGGAYREALIDGWLKDTVPDVYKQEDALVRSQEQPGEAWWAPINGTNYYQNVTWPSLAWAGHYDIFQHGNLHAFNGYQHKAALPGQAKLFIDPLGHCQAGASYFTHDTIFGRVLLPILMALDFMRDDSVTNKTYPDPPEGVGNVTIYVMGAEEDGAPGQYWTSLPEVATPAFTDYFLHPDGTLTTDAPPAGPAASTYIYDPTDPVPTIGGDNLLIACGPLDQAPLETRQDVLLFTSEVLTSTLTLSGEVTATLYVSSNATDTDFVAKLIDVYPANSSDAKMANSSTLVVDGIVRMKWRKFVDGAQTNLPQLLSGNPSDVYEVTFSLWNTTYIFAPGHRIRVHVTSSNWPRFFPNYNDGLSFNSTGHTNVTAANTLHTDSAHPSRITLPVVTAAQLPPFPVEETTEIMALPHADAWRARRAAAVEAGLEVEGGLDLPFLDWLQAKMERVRAAFFGRRLAEAGARKA